jgi:hypothetical protein
MQMYAVVNVENLKLYEPPLIDDQGEHVQIPSIDDFSPEYLTEFKFICGSSVKIIEKPN